VFPPSALGNDGVDGAAAIADHKSVLDGPAAPRSTSWKPVQSELTL